MKFLYLATLLSTLNSGFGFCTAPSSSSRQSAGLFQSSRVPLVVGAFQTTALFDMRSSRLEGNMRQPSAEEVALMDEMITKLADAKPYELPNAVRRAFRYVVKKLKMNGLECGSCRVSDRGRFLQKSGGKTHVFSCSVVSLPGSFLRHSSFCGLLHSPMMPRMERKRKSSLLWQAI